jgi:hypothetical protein
MLRSGPHWRQSLGIALKRKLRMVPDREIVIVAVLDDPGGEADRPFAVRGRGKGHDKIQPQQCQHGPTNIRIWPR